MPGPGEHRSGRDEVAPTNPNQEVFARLFARNLIAQTVGLFAHMICGNTVQ